MTGVEEVIAGVRAGARRAVAACLVPGAMVSIAVSNSLPKLR